LSEGVPCQQNGFVRKTDMVTKVFVDPLRRTMKKSKAKSRLSESSQEEEDFQRAVDAEYNRLVKIQSTPWASIGKLDTIVRCRLTEQDITFMRDNGIVMGYLPVEDEVRLP
jgi:hypothetical protein